VKIIKLEVIEMHGKCGHSRKMGMYSEENDRFNYCYKCAKVVMFSRAQVKDVEG